MSVYITRQPQREQVQGRGSQVGLRLPEGVQGSQAHRRPDCGNRQDLRPRPGFGTRVRQKPARLARWRRGMVRHSVGGRTGCQALPRGH